MFFRKVAETTECPTRNVARQRRLGTSGGAALSASVCQKSGGRLDMKSMLMTVLLAAVAVVTFADSPATEMKPATSFGFLDTNKDLRVSPGEAKADWAVAHRFEQADLNHDGYLDKDEFATLSH
jgi:EF hand